MHYRAVLNNDQRLNQEQEPLITPVAGNAIGIIAVNLNYPKLPGNVVNATTFKFPVEYEVIDVAIEDLFAGNPDIKDTVIQAAQKLESRGVWAVVGACGYFANFQDEVKNAVNIPVFLSSLAQLPIIKLGLRNDQKVGVFVASYENATEEFLNKSNASKAYCVIQDIGSLSKFHPIRYGEPVLDNQGLTQQLTEVSSRLVAEHPEIGAILLECSDLPPYASAIQSAVGLPVFDFITLINWVFQAVVQTPYYGYY